MTDDTHTPTYDGTESRRNLLKMAGAGLVAAPLLGAISTLGMAQTPNRANTVHSNTPPLDAGLAGQFRIGGDMTVNRLGYGAIRITGPGIWGEPERRPEALQLLKRLPEIGVNFIDTADAYGPFVSEDLIAEALAPYHGFPHQGLHISPKAALSGPTTSATRGWKSDTPIIWNNACA